MKYVNKFWGKRYPESCQLFKSFYRLQFTLMYQEKLIFLSESTSSARGGLMIFSDYKISISTLSGIFDEKVGPFSEFLCLMEVSKYGFEGCFGKNGFDFQNIFQKLWIFVQTRSKKSINSVFFWLVICVIKITDPLWNFLQIL